MKFGVLGSGMVGHGIAGKLVSLGHEVRMGSRTADNPKSVEWAASAGERASTGTFADAAAFGDIVVNATGGAVSLEALRQAGADNLAGKVLIDIANPLDTSQLGTLTVHNTDSLGEQIQRTFPQTRVVKALNTVNVDVMVRPGVVPGPHAIFVSGNDADAKAEVVALLEAFGWPRADIVDLGDISTARGTEMYLPLWLRLMSALGTPHFNIAIKRG